MPADPRPARRRPRWRDRVRFWVNTPTNYYFTGSLAFACVHTYALTAAQVSAHYGAGR